MKIKNIKSGLPGNVKLVAVSKTKPIEIILDAYNSGHLVFGENKVQDLVKKHELLPKDIEWHFIGHLQTNKVKYIASFVDLIHAVDSLKLLKVINKEAKKAGRVVPCLLQIHIAKEGTKFGLTKQDATVLLESDLYKEMQNVRIDGVMGMATYTDDINVIKEEFRNLMSIFGELKSDYFSDSVFFKEISMGMSDDYEIAIEQGSTIIRVGSKIFGARQLMI